MSTHHLQRQPKIAILAVSYQETQKKGKREKELWVKPETLNQLAPPRPPGSAHFVGQ
jgi:hypothetical protein